MPTIRRPDGVEIWWDSRGEGPPVLIVQAWGTPPEVLEALTADLERDHRVVLHHPRGAGRSTRRGPYDAETDAGDLEALAEEVGGGPAVAVTMADGTNRTLRVAARRPDLIDVVVTPGGVPLTEELLDVSSSLASPSVIEALMQQVRSDHRGAARTIVSYNNPQMSEDEIRERVVRSLEYCPQEAAVGRYEAWIEEDPTEFTLAVGDRLIVLVHEGNVWFPPDLAERARERFPEMQVRLVDDGVISRPDFTAAAVRSATRARV
jgi:pimeloyl-ACP methyl ester carboxylesterase